MKCVDIKNVMYDFVLEEIDPDIEIRIHEHLAECEACRTAVREIEDFTAQLQSPTRFTPDAQVYRRVKQALPRKQKRKIFALLPVSVGYALAAFLLGAVVMRAADIFIVRGEQTAEKEIRYEPLRKMPYADTVEFYTVPVENLVRS
jgi:predicted anti-sigma-YlaC factor YlaD